jgi:hypothetical protein
MSHINLMADDYPGFARVAAALATPPVQGRTP